MSRVYDSTCVEDRVLWGFVGLHRVVGGSNERVKHVAPTRFPS